MYKNYDSLGTGRDTWLKNGIGGDVGSSPTHSRKSTFATWIVVLMTFLSLAIGERSWAQSTLNYAYATNTNGSLGFDKDGNALDMSTGSTQLYGANVDSYTNPGAQNFPWTFYFMGAGYSQWNVNPDGQMRLGSTLLTGHTSSAAASSAFLIANNTDAVTGATGKVHFKVFGTAPNRVLVVEWKDIALYWNVATTNYSSWQTRIYESGNIVEYVYGNMFHNNTSSYSSIIGISSSNTTNTVGTVTNILSASPAYIGGTAYTTTSFPASSSLTNLSSATEGSRRYFRFTPASSVSGDASSLTYTAISANATTPNWVDSATNEVGFLVTRATDVSFTQNVVTTVVPTTTSAGTGTAYTSVQTGLAIETTYYYKVQALVEGGASAGITGSQATSPAGNITSTGTGGDWNNIATWSGGVVPTINDNVTIADGATVTINNTSAVCNNLTVGQGTTGILTWAGGTTAATLNVAGNVTVAAGGIFNSGTGTGTKTLNIGGGAAVASATAFRSGNLTVNGTFNMASSATSFVAVSFFGSLSGAISGSGTLAFQGITVNKGNSIASILDVTSVITMPNALTSSGTRLTISNGSFKLSSASVLAPYFGGQTITTNSTARLWLNHASASISCVGAGTATGAGSPTVNGTLQIDNGTFNYGSGNNTMTFGSTAGILTVNGGTFNMYGAITMPSNAGNQFNMTGGAINIDPNAANALGTGTTLFSIGASASVNWTNGTVIIVDPHSASGGTAFSCAAGGTKVMSGSATLQLGDGTSTTTGGTLANTSGFGVSSLGMELANLVVNNRTDAFTSRMARLTGNTFVKNLTLNANSYLFGASGTTTTTVLVLSGNLANNGILAGTEPGGTQTIGTVQVSGTAAQTVSGSGTFVNIGALSIANTSTGVAFTQTNQFNALRVNRFQGNTTGSGKITVGLGGATTNTIQYGAAAGTVNAGSFDAAPTFNVGSGGLNLLYLQESGSRTTSFEIPASRAVNAMTINNTNGVVLNGGNLSVAATTNALVLTAGNLTTNSSNILTIAGSGATALSGGSATSYVNGPIARTLPVSLATGTNYIFPVGKGTYNPFVLVNPTTNAGGTVTIQSEVFDANSGGTPSGNIGSLKTNRYWASSITNGATNFTNTLIQLNDTPAGADAIAESNTVNGAYTLTGGTTITSTGTSLTSTAPASTSLAGFYAMGNKASASLANLAIAPTGNQCTNVARTVTVDVTPGGSATATVELKYQVNGGAVQTVSMTNVTGLGELSTDTWTGTIPTVTPVNAAVTWTVTATDANTLFKTQSGTAYTDAPFTGTASLASASLATVCFGSPTVLTGTVGSQGTRSVGAGASTSSSLGGTMFPGAWGGAKSQYIVRASELIAAGIGPGNISSIAFDVTAAGQSYPGFAVTVGTTATQTKAAGFEAVSGSTFTSASYLPTVGVNTLTLSPALAWDGTSNLMITVCWSTGNSTSSGSTVRTDTAAFTSSYGWQADSQTAAAICGTSGVPSSGNTPVLGATRPKFTFAGLVATPMASYSWSDGSTVVGTTNPLTVSPTTTTTYTVTMSNAEGCTTTANTTVTVNPLPAAPTSTPSTRCGTGVSAASVASTSGLPTPTFRWYAASTGGSFLQSSTSTTYTTPITATTTFYVSEYNGTCESTRTAVVATVDAPPAITVTPVGSTGTFCGTGTFNVELNATSGDSGMSYVWTTTSTTASGITGANTATLSANVTETTDFIVTGTPSDPSCAPIVKQYSISVYPLPTATVTTTASGVCPGTSATINSGLSAGNFTATCLTPITTLSTPPPSAVTLISGGTINVTQSNTTPSVDDGYWNAIPLGFSFDYFGTPYTTLNISTNGVVNFGATGVTQFAFAGPPAGFPSTANPANTIAVGARDMYLLSGSIKYWTEGVSPNRKFVVQYANCPSYVTTGTATGNNSIEAVFYETLGIVDIRAIQATNGTGGTNNAITKYIGLQNGDRTIGATAPNCTTNVQNYWNGVTAEIASPQTWRFQPPSHYTVTWTAHDDVTNVTTTPVDNVTDAFSLNVSPVNTTTYTISYTNQTTGCTNLLNSAQVTMAVISDVAPTTSAIATPSTICAGGSSVLSLNYSGSTAGLTFQWQSSADGVSFTDIAGQTAATTTVTPSAVTVYRCLVKSCTGTPVASDPITVFFTNNIATTTPATRCGTGTVSLSATTSSPGASIKWYDVATGGTALFTGGTYVTTVSATKIYYVAAETTGPACSSERVAVVATVTTAPAFALNTSSTTAVCPSTNTAAVTVVTNAGTYNNFSWSPATGVTGDEVSGWVFNVSQTSVYTLTVTNADGCINHATVTVNVNDVPVTASASLTTVCAGAATTLTAKSLVIGSGPSTLPGTYCVADSSGGSGSDPITSVTFNTLSNTGIVNASPYYTIYPDSGTTTTTVTAGETYPLTVVTSTSTIVSVWIDYDRNGTFEDSEWQQVRTTGTTSTIDVVIPSGAAAGHTTMRIRSRGFGNASTAADECTGFFSGVSQDYSINILGVIDGSAALDFVWSPGGATGASIVVNPTTTTEYTVTATNSSTGCSNTAQVTVNTTALPDMPGVNNSTQCGPGTPTASVTSLNTSPVFKWYTVSSGGTALAGQSGASLNNYVINETTTFYVSEVRGALNCESPRATVVATVSAPGVATPPSISGSSTVNIGASVSLTATGTGGTINWYTTATGGTAVFTGNTYNIPAACAPTTKTYYAEEVAAEGCPSLRSSHTVTANPLISTDPANALICSTGGEVTLTANVAGATGVIWSPATGLSSTNQLSVIASPSVTTQYTFTATVAGCGTVTGTINVGVIQGASFTPSATPASICEGGTSVLNSNLSSSNFVVSCITAPSSLATPPVGAVTLANAGTATTTLSGGVLDDGYWNARPIGFSFNYFGTPYTTLNVGTNGTINFGATGNTQYIFTGGFPNASNPASTIAVVARDNYLGTSGAVRTWTEGTAPTRRFVVQYNNVATLYSDDSTDGTTSAELVLYETTGVVEIRVIQATNPSDPTSTANSLNKYIGLQNGDQTIGATAPNCSTPFQANYWNGIANAISTPLAWRFSPPVNYTFQWFTDGNPIDGATSATYTTPALAAGSHVYTVEALSPLTQCAISANVTVTSGAAPAAPVAGADNTACANVTPQLLTVSVPAGVLVDWYAAATGGTALLVNNVSYSTSTPGTYYAQARTASGCLSTERTPMTYAPAAVPMAPSATATVNYCQFATASALTATADSGNTLNWYTVSTGGTPSAFAPTPSTATAGTTDYWVAQVNSSGCISNRTQVSVVVAPAPAAPATTNPTAYCQGDTAADLNLSATAVGGNTLKFYNAASEGTLLGTGSYVPSTATAGSTVYYVSQTNAGSCEGPRAAITVVVNPTLVASVAVSASTTSVCTGGGITFTATPTNGGTPTYKWFLNDVEVSGETASTYVLATPAADDEVYAVMTSTATPCLIGSPSTSNLVVLTGASGTPSVSISASPNTPVCAGTPISFSVQSSANMGATPTYQWLLNGSAITGETNATYTSSALANGAMISLEMTSSIDPGCLSATFATSTAITVVVNPATSIGTAPTAQSACIGGNVTFSVVAAGTGPFTYQWKKGAATISGAISSSYSINGVVANDADNYSVEITGACGSMVSSTPVALTVNPATVVNVSSITQCAGTTATFTANVTGTPATTYQWRKGGVDIGGATSSTLVLSNITGADAGNYSVFVTGTCGNATSNTASLTVNPLVAISQQPTAAVTACAGSPINLSVTASGSGTLTYQWKLDGNDIPSATSSTYSTTAVSNGTYTVLVTSSACGSLLSNAAVVTVNPVTAITGQPSTQTVCGGSTATFSVSASGSGTIAYQWFIGSSPISNGNGYSGATTSTLTVTNVNEAQHAGVYRVRVSGGSCNAGNIMSNNVSLIVRPNNAIVLSSAAGTANQTACINSAIVNITYATTTATGANFSGLPTGVSGSWSGNVATISGTPTVTGTFNYTVTATGGCGSQPSLGGTITVEDAILTGNIPEQSICGGATPADLVLTGNTGTIVKWQKATNSGFTGAVDINTTSNTLTSSEIGAVLTTTYFRAVLQGCATVFSDVATITAASTIYTSAGWSNGLPNASTGAVISDDFTSTGDLSACSLTVTAGSEVVVNTGHIFNITNAVVVASGDGAKLTFANNAYLLQDDAAVANTNSGDIIYMRNSTMKRFDYVYWGSPVENQNLSSFSPWTVHPQSPYPGAVGTSRFYDLNEAANLFEVIANPATQPWDGGKGFMIRAPNNFPTNGSDATFLGKFTGRANNGTYTQPISWHAGRGYNMLGNPYPSVIDADLFLNYSTDGGVTKPNAGTLYFWTHFTQTTTGGSNYATYNGTGAAAAAATNILGSAAITPNGLIAAGQGFLLRKMGGNANQTATFRNSMRVDPDAEPVHFFRSGNTTEKNRIWLNLSNDTTARFNQALIGYITGATQGADEMFDGLLYYSGSSISTAIGTGTEKYVIQGRSLPFDATDVVPVVFKAETAGTYTISIDHVDGLFEGDQDIFLRDNLAGVEHDIKGSGYTFVSDAGTFANRFAVVYQSSLDIENPTFDSNTIVVYKKEGVLHVNSGTTTMANVKIFDMRGRLIYEKDGINSNATSLNDLRAEQQVLLLQVTSDENKTVTKKVAN